MPMSAVYCGEDTLSDRARWQFDVLVTDSDTGQPMNLTGSVFRCPLRALGDGALVADTASDGDMPLITIADATGGRLSFDITAAGRNSYLAPRSGWLGYARVTAVVGDLRRYPSPSATEAEDTARITIKVRPGT